MSEERVDNRVLGAVRFTDRATGIPIIGPLAVAAAPARLVRNRGGLYVVHAAPGFAEHVREFRDVPTTPPRESVPVALTVTDPGQRYLPRTATIRLPRDADPANRRNDDSLFRPIDVTLYHGRNAKMQFNWSRVRATVTRAGDPVRGALLRVVQTADAAVLASGITDADGEALVAVPGVPITRFSDEDERPGQGGGRDTPAVVVSELPVSVEVSLSAEPEWPVDADELERDHATQLATILEVPPDLALRTGATLRVDIRLEP